MIGWLAEAGGTPPPARNNFGDTMSDGLAGPMALLIIVLLAIATVLLIRNMNGRLRRLPDRFPTPVGGGSSPADGDVKSTNAGSVPRGSDANPPGTATTNNSERSEARRHLD